MLNETFKQQQINFICEKQPSLFKRSELQTNQKTTLWSQIQILLGYSDHHRNWRILTHFSELHSCVLPFFHES